MIAEFYRSRLSPPGSTTSTAWRTRSASGVNNLRGGRRQERRKPFLLPPAVCCLLPNSPASSSPHIVPERIPSGIRILFIPSCSQEKYKKSRKHMFAWTCGHGLCSRARQQIEALAESFHLARTSLFLE